MKQTRLLMGMPITVEIIDPTASMKNIETIYDYFIYIDNTFSTYNENSEITLINKSKIKKADFSRDMATVFLLSEITRLETGGYFDISHNGKYDPSGIVKGWAILNAANILKKSGFKNYYIEAGGDIQSHGENRQGNPWRIGIRNPFKLNEIVKVIEVGNSGVATSGTYIRGQHIYNPKGENQNMADIVSLTVVGPDIYEADRFTTAAFAMGENGIQFIEKLPGFEAYMIDKNGIATYTSRFNQYVRQV